MALLLYLFAALAILILISCIRLFGVLPRWTPRKPVKRRRGEPVHILIVLGSGGHTTEMLLLLRELNTAHYTFRRYVISSGDNFSAEKALAFESGLSKAAAQKRINYGGFDIKSVTRARRIHQSLLTTPLSVVRCAWDVVSLLMTLPSTHNSARTWKTPYPDLIVTNGPATATIVIFTSLFLRFLGLKDAGSTMRCVYVESWARVRKLSLSGRILSASGVCERLLVQWEALSQQGLEFKGQLIA